MNINELIQRTNILMTEAASITDKAVLSLPDPIRTNHNKVIDTYIDFLGDEAEILGRMGAEESVTVEAIIAEFRKANTSFPNAKTLSSFLPKTNLNIVMQRIIYRLSGGKLFTFRDSLTGDLEQTDFGNDLPTSFFKLPFKHCYFKFGQTPSSSLSVTLPETGAHIAEGCYITHASGNISKYGVNCPKEEHSLQIGLKEGEPLQAYDLAIVGSPCGKQGGLFDDSFKSTVLYITESMLDQPLLELMERQVSVSMKYDPSGVIGQKQSTLDELLAVTGHAIKCALYLTVKDVRQEFYTPYTDLAEKIEKAGASKKGKLKRQQSKVYDTILVGPSRDTDNQNGIKSGSKVTPHLRRGHFRRVRYGKGKMLSYPRYIAPVHVNENEGPEIDPKDYDVE